MEIQRLTQIYNQTIGQAQTAYNPAEEGAVIQQTTQQKMSAALNQMLLSLRPGQVFSAQITDIRGFLLELTLSNQQKVTAKISEGIEYVIGQQALFLVKENDGEQLLITPAGSAGTPEQAAILAMSKALQAAELPVTDRNLELVKTMMEEHLPVDRQNLLSYAKEALQYPDVEISALVTLKKNQIPLTIENIRQYENYKNNEHQLLSDVRQLSQEMGHFITDTALTEGPEKARDLFAAITEVLELGDIQEKIAVKEPVREVPENSLGQEPKLLMEQPQAKNPMALANREALAELIRQMGDYPKMQEVILEEQSPPEKIFGQLNQMLQEPTFPPENIRRLFQNEGIRELLNSVMENKFLLEPRELREPEGVKNFYRRVADKAEQLEKVIQEFNKSETGFGKAASNMHQNLRFMHSLNETMTYIQLPLKLAKQEAHGDLYVYTKKNLLQKKGEELTAMLHLDMEHLGSVDVFIRMQMQNVSTNFTLETEEMLDFVEEHIELLEERLNKKGYHLSFSVQQKPSEKQVDFVEDFLKKEAPPSEIKRFSFDVRA